jgi:hypothetical protein
VLREHGRQLVDPAGELEQLRVQLENQRDAGREHAATAREHLHLVALGVDEEESTSVDDVVQARDLDLLTARGFEARPRSGRDIHAHRPAHRGASWSGHRILDAVQCQVRPNRNVLGTGSIAITARTLRPGGERSRADVRAHVRVPRRRSGSCSSAAAPTVPCFAPDESFPSVGSSVGTTNSSPRARRR